MTTRPEVVVVNVTSAPAVLGGAVLAAQWHSWFMAKKINLELWRMWDQDQVHDLDGLRIRNFESRVKFGALGKSLPRLAIKTLLESDIPQTLRKLKPKIVHLQNPSPSIEFEKIARLCQQQGTKVVASTHGFQEMFEPQYGFDALHQRIGWDLLLRKPLHRAFEHVDAFLLGFPKQREFLARRGVPDQKMHLVPNGIDPTFAQASSSADVPNVKAKFGLVDKDPVLLFMGNHTPNKGLGTLIKLAQSMDRPATFVVGGKLLPGEPGKWLDGVILPQGVRVVFTGFLTVEEQRALYHAATIFIFPSISETLPLVVLEAMAAGLPTVAFDTGGVSFQLENGAGIAAPLQNFDALRNAVLQILNDDLLRASMSKAAQKRQRDIFRWDILADKTIDIYKQLADFK
jgi:alpha-maltose-1-phosphate synthase